MQHFDESQLAGPGCIVQRRGRPASRGRGFEIGAGLQQQLGDLGVTFYRRDSQELDLTAGDAHHHWRPHRRVLNTPWI